ncbi:hypothetical protein [Weissella confusa]|nr:hypothetical protein [Weissella confusa]
MINQFYVLLPMFLLIGGVMVVYLIISVLIDFYKGALVIEEVDD